MVVIASIYEHLIWVRIDSGATIWFMSLEVGIPLEIETAKDYTFLELGDGQKILSKGKSVNIILVTSDLPFHLDLTITSLLHDVDLILVINLLQAVNPLID